MAAFYKLDNKGFLSPEIKNTIIFVYLSIMKKYLFFTPLLLSFMFLSPTGYGMEIRNKELVIHELKLDYPCPAIPFYHFIAEMELPYASIIEAEAAVNGETLRFTDLHRADELTDMDRPVISHRPPSGYGLSQDGTLYQHPHLVGWVRWEPGEAYEITIRVRMKEQIHASENDVFLTATKTLKAPDAAATFDKAWKNYKAVVVTETAGIDRKSEPVQVLLPFYPDEAQQLTRDIRVVAVDPQTHEVSEVPSQVYDLQQFLQEDDLAPDEQGHPTREIPLWMGTVTARVASFLTTASAHGGRGVPVSTTQQTRSSPPVTPTSRSVTGRVADAPRVARAITAIPSIADPR